jgi:hypothetical protein
MEVHGHSHTPPGNHRDKRQKWKHYFWEFFMLFLAVFCGYLAERKFEHDIQRLQEKKYMKTLAADLKKDILEIDRLDIFRLHREKQLDTLIGLLGQKKIALYVKDIYRLSDTTDGYESFIRNDRTIQQLKNTGSMRLINEDVAAEIMRYDNYIAAEIDWNNQTEAGRIDNYKEQRFQLFDTESIIQTSNKNTSFPLKLLPADPLTINIIRGSLFQVKRISETNRKSGEAAKAIAGELLAAIEKEYHIH